MDWKNLPRSGGGVQRSGGGGLPGGGLAVGGGIGGLIIALIAMFFGVDPGAVLGGGGAPPAQTQPQTQPGAGQAAESEVVRKAVLSTITAAAESLQGSSPAAFRAWRRPIR